MESNKENIKRSPPKSRIPLPLRPVVTRPKTNFGSSVNGLIASDTKIQRQPLKTLNHHNIDLPGPSNVITATKLKHVTFRDKKEPAICHAEKANTVKIGNENKASGSKIVDSKPIAQNDRDDRIGGVGRTATPMSEMGQIENLRVKNIKKSLKRPHSRELQGISPNYRRDQNRDNQFNICQKESLKDRLQTPDFFHRSYMTCMARDYVTDVYNYLLEVERKPLDIPQIKNVTRSCLINWLMKVNGMTGQPSTVQTACWYLDSVLGTGYVELDNLQLVAAASFWIAQKLQGPYLCASKIVKCANLAFTCVKLLAAEKAVLVRLNFPPQPVVPQDFINYLAWWCDSEQPGEIELAATFLCMSGLMVDKSLCQDYPSVIAAAAMRNALLLYKGKHLMKRLMNCPIYKVVETKAANFPRTCSILRRAVRTVASTDYEYKAPYEQFGFSPANIAQKVVSATRILHESDKKHY